MPVGSDKTRGERNCAGQLAGALSAPWPNAVAKRLSCPGESIRDQQWGRQLQQELQLFGLAQRHPCLQPKRHILLFKLIADADGRY